MKSLKKKGSMLLASISYFFQNAFCSFEIEFQSLFTSILSSENDFNLDQSKCLQSGKDLSRRLVNRAKIPFVDSVDQDEITQNV